jgi:hypothetical protein
MAPFMRHLTAHSNGAEKEEPDTKPTTEEGGQGTQAGLEDLGELLLPSLDGGPASFSSSLYDKYYFKYETVWRLLNYERRGLHPGSGPKQR